MHAAPRENNGPKQGLFEGVTWYHWLVVIIASGGWLFDCMDQRLFTMARESSLKELLGNSPQALNLERFLGLATASMMIGWATGGIIFGMMSDRWGRVKTMVATLFVYSAFTGLCGIAQTWWDFTLYRFLVGLGVGGMFGAATTLVAESVPGRFRSVALGSLQAFSATGNILGSILSLYIQPGAENVMAGMSGWRLLFFVGILPSLLVVPIIFILREPEAWKKAKADAAATGTGRKSMGSPAELFRHPRWRRHTLVGLGLGVAGMVGLWGIGFFSPELITSALKGNPLEQKEIKDAGLLVTGLATAEGADALHIRKQLRPAALEALEKAGAATALPPAVIDDLNRLITGENLYAAEAFQNTKLSKGTEKLISKVKQKATPADVSFLNRQLIEQTFPGAIAERQKYVDGVRSKAMILFDIGAFLGMMVFTFFAAWSSRRGAFLWSFVACLAITVFVFYSLKTEANAYWMLFLMGAAQLAVFAGYSIYFPELYPTRLRGTGVGFCYNTVRYVAAPFPYLLGYLGSLLSLRTAGMIMASIYVIGMLALIWAPETKGQPLPED